MAYTKASQGERLFKFTNIKPKTPVSTYTTPAVGDLVKVDTTGNDLVARCAAGDVPIGIILSVNSSNGILSVAHFSADVTVIVEYTGAFAIGDKVVSNGDRGTVMASRDRVKRDNSTGTGTVLAKDWPATSQCVVSY